MMQTLLETGSPVIHEIVVRRKSYSYHPLIALGITTALVLIWVVYCQIGALKADPVTSTSPVENVRDDQLPPFEDDPLIAEIDTAYLLDPWEITGHYDIMPYDLTTLPPSTTSEDTVTLKKIRINVNYNNTTVSDVLHDIEGQTGLTFTFPSNVVARIPNVTLTRSNCTPHELLTEILCPRGLRFVKLSYEKPNVSIFEAL